MPFDAEICKAEHSRSDTDSDKSSSSDDNLPVQKNLNNFETLFYISIFMIIKCLLYVLLFHIVVLFGITVEFLI